MTLATRLPWTHPFSGGYPRIGGQPLPTDPDAIDYLQRQAAVDGPVEVGVAMAVDQFVKGCKADSAGYAGDPTRTVWDALQASCIMCGARTISGALVPLVGTAPTPYNLTNFDYARTTGIKGDGTTTYLDSNRANTADGDTDQHIALYVSASATVGGGYAGCAEGSSTGATHFGISGAGGTFFIRNKSSSADTLGDADATGLVGMSRSDGDGYAFHHNGVSQTVARAYQATFISDIGVFARLPYTTSQKTDARLAFYSIGSAIPNLAALDARVTNLVKGIQFWNYTGLSPHAYDPDTIAYVVAGYAAGGTL